MTEEDFFTLVTIISLVENAIDPEARAVRLIVKRDSDGALMELPTSIARCQHFVMGVLEQFAERAHAAMVTNNTALLDPLIDRPLEHPTARAWPPHLSDPHDSKNDTSRYTLAAALTEIEKIAPVRAPFLTTDKTTGSLDLKHFDECMQHLWRPDAPRCGNKGELSADQLKDRRCLWPPAIPTPIAEFGNKVMLCLNGCTDPILQWFGPQLVAEGQVDSSGVDLNGRAVVPSTFNRGASDAQTIDTSQNNPWKSVAEEHGRDDSGNFYVSVSCVDGKKKIFKVTLTDEEKRGRKSIEKWAEPLYEFNSWDEPVFLGVSQSVTFKLANGRSHHSRDIGRHDWLVE
eukprot:178834_1